MSGNYYYFISSLPHLRPGEEPPFSVEEFMSQCAYQFSDSEVEQISTVALEPEGVVSDPTHARWCAFETCLRNNIATARASRLKREAQPCLRTESDAFGGLESQIQDALSRDPLAMEEQLDRIRWQFLDSLLVGHMFDQATIIVYRIKLLLLEKRAGISAEQGQSQLDETLKRKLTSDQLPEFIHG